MTTVALIDDQALVRAGFRALLDSEEDIEVVGQAADGEQGLALVRRTQPDVVLMDIRMPVLDGLAATAQITSDPKLADSRVIVLTTFELDEYVFGALRAGASGFLLKDLEPVDLINAVRVVSAGEALLAPRLTRRLIEAFVDGGGGRGGGGGDGGGGGGGGGGTGTPDGVGRAAPAPEDDPRLRELTPREREVLTLVGRGLSNAEIAAELVLSPLTAKTHVARLFSKLGARDRAQLVVIAYESGLIAPRTAGAGHVS